MEAMLIRIVRMTFLAHRVNDFLDVFEANKHKIRGFEGCTHLELLKDHHDPYILSTYSIWEDDAALQAYRRSALFQEVWGKTKRLFKDKPIAFSSTKYIEV